MNREQHLEQLVNEGNYYAIMQKDFEISGNGEIYSQIQWLLPIAKEQCKHKQDLSNIPTVHTVSARRLKIEGKFYIVSEAFCSKCGKICLLTVAVEKQY